MLSRNMILDLMLWSIVLLNRVLTKSIQPKMNRKNDSLTAFSSEQEVSTVLHKIITRDDTTHWNLRRAQMDSNGTNTDYDPNNPNDKIVSGTVVTDRNKYPFIAWPDVRSGGIFCDATLIFPDFLLSAAHCSGAFKGKTVFIGGTSVSGTNAQEAILAVQEYIHPSYNSNKDQYDFMLVKLQRSATAVLPASWNTNTNAPSNSGTLAVVIGYGKTSATSSLSTSLREAQVRTTTYCQSIYTNIDLGVEICAGPATSNESPCMGDSGGPLLVNGVVVGVVSFGDAACTQGYPAVYARVSSAKTWIDDTICAHSAVPPGNCPPQINNGDCFSGSNLVEVKDKGLIFMSELQIGDYVKSGRSGDETFTQVYSFAHLNREIQVEYFQIYVDVAQKPLEISKQHLLYIANDKLVPADDVRVGDELMYQGKLHQVVRIKKVQRQGLYHPVTESGEIIVSGVRASTYARLLQLDSWVESFATHSLLSPLRWACRFDFSICQNESYTEEGFSATIDFAIQLAFRISKQNSILQIFWLILSAPAIALFLIFLNIFYIASSCSVVYFVTHLLLSNRKTTAKHYQI